MLDFDEYLYERSTVFYFRYLRANSSATSAASVISYDRCRIRYGNYISYFVLYTLLSSFEIHCDYVENTVDTNRMFYCYSYSNIELQMIFIEWVEHDIDTGKL